MKSRHIVSWIFASMGLAAIAFVRNMPAPPGPGVSLLRRKTAFLGSAIAIILILGLSCALPASVGALSVANGDYEYHYYGPILPTPVLHADMTAHFSHPDFMWGCSMDGVGFSFHLEAYELRKAPNGDWWADSVVLNGIELEFQNLGSDPFLWGLRKIHAANGASSPGAWINCYFGYPPSTYRPSSITLSAGGMVNTAGVRHIYAQGGTSLAFNMSAGSPGNNSPGIGLYAVSGQTETDWAYGSNNWQCVYSVSGTAGSFSHALDPNVRHYYFLGRSWGDTASVPAITHVEVTNTPGVAPNTIQGWDVSLYEGQEIWPGMDYGSFAWSTRGIGMDDNDIIHPYQYMINGHTGWVTVSGYGSYESETWTPPHAGDYQIYYMQLGNGEWANSNMSGPHTLRVLPASVTAHNVTASVGALNLDAFTSAAVINVAPGLSYSSHVIIEGHGTDPDFGSIPVGTYQFQIMLECSGDDPYGTYCGAPPEIVSSAGTLTIVNSAVPPPLLTLDSVSSNVYNDQNIIGSGWAADPQEGAPVNRVGVWVDGAHRGYAALGGDRPDVAGAHNRSDWRYSGFNFSFPASGLMPGPHTVELRAYGNAGMSTSESRDLNIGNRPPVANRPEGPARAYVSSLCFYYASGSDPDGDLETQEFCAAEPGAPFGVNNNYWPNCQSLPAGNGYSASVLRTLTFNRAGRWELHYRLRDTSGWYGTNTTSNWSPVLPVMVSNMPSITIAADNSNLSLGGSTTLRAHYSVDTATGDSLTLTTIKRTGPDGTVESGQQSGNQTWTFTPTHTGTYTFKAYAKTTVAPEWNAYATCTVTVIGVNNAEFVSQSVPSEMISGGRATVSVTMRNNGSLPWANTQPNPHALGSQSPQDNYTWGLNRVSVGGIPVQPGQNKTFAFTITAPSTPGNYDFQWRMVQDGKGWFGEPTPNVVVAVRSLTDLGLDGLPIGLYDSNTNGVSDLVEASLGLDPAANNDNDPRIQSILQSGTKGYLYDNNSQMTTAPERTYELDDEGNITQEQD